LKRLKEAYFLLHDSQWFANGKVEGAARKSLMDKIRKILAPTDFSELSQVGVRYALEMAKSLGAEVIISHVVGIAEECM
jgi:hypothetical protein